MSSPAAARIPCSSRASDAPLAELLPIPRRAHPARCGPSLRRAFRPGGPPGSVSWPDVAAGVIVASVTGTMRTRGRATPRYRSSSRPTRSSRTSMRPRPRPRSRRRRHLIMLPDPDVIVPILRSCVLAQEFCRSVSRANVEAVFERCFNLRCGDKFIRVGDLDIGNGPLTLIGTSGLLSDLEVTAGAIG